MHPRSSTGCIIDQEMMSKTKADYSVPSCIAAIIGTSQVDTIDPSLEGYRLNLAAIESTLRDVQRNFSSINRHLQTRRDNLDDEVLANMMAGYACIDNALGKELDLLAPGNLKHLLELNSLVLCGLDPVTRAQSVKHMAATEKQFYDNRRGGIQDVIEWHEKHKGASIWKRSAGIYIRMLSRPQLFIEGNHRVGALVMSYLLVRDGKPPFVLTVDNAKSYFDPSSLVKKSKKDSITLLFRFHKLNNYFAEFLQENTYDGHLLCCGVND